MSNPSDKHSMSLRDKIIGLGENSIRKSYYPQLQLRLEEVELARNRLAQSEARYRHLVESINDVIFSLDCDGIITYISPTINTLGGWSPEQLMGRSFMDLIHPNDRSESLPCSPSFIPDSHRVDVRFLAADETYRYVRLSCQPTRDSTIPEGRTGILSDITDQKKAEQKQEKLQQQLNHVQKMDSIGRLAGGVAHDFNNLLGVIIGNSELILSQLPPETPFKKELEEILHTSQRASDLTRQLLAFARRQAVTPRLFHINDRIHSMLKMVRRLLGENIDLSWSPGEQSMTVKMDPTHLDQILANLCVNARDAIKDTGSISIATSLITWDDEYCNTHLGEGLPGTFVMLSVSDSGCGMERETLNYIFEPFFTTKDISKGTGLGLSTVYGIVQQNNGFITVTSEPGRGSTFNIHFPLADSRQETSAAPPPPDASATGTETILVVEDEPILLMTVRRMLEILGYKVITANSPESAIQNAKTFEGNIHLLLSDILMPGMNGSEMAARILEIRPNVKLIFMSGYSGNAVVRQNTLSSTERFIHKPFSIRDLASIVRDTIDSA